MRVEAETDVEIITKKAESKINPKAHSLEGLTRERKILHKSDE